METQNEKKIPARIYTLFLLRYWFWVWKMQPHLPRNTFTPPIKLSNKKSVSSVFIFSYVLLSAYVLSHSARTANRNVPLYSNTSVKSREGGKNGWKLGIEPLWNLMILPSLCNSWILIFNRAFRRFFLGTNTPWATVLKYWCMTVVCMCEVVNFFMVILCFTSKFGDGRL